MNLKEYLISLVSYLPLIPSAILCFAPMKNRLRFKMLHIMISVICFFAVVLPILSYVETRYSLAYNSLMLPLLVLCFISYCMMLNTHISQSLSIYLLVMALMAFMSNFSNAFDAFMHPESDLDHFSLEAAVFQIFISVLLACILYYPFSRYGSYLIDNLNQKSIWYIFSVISGIFIIYNINNVVHYYSTMHTNHVARAYMTNMILLFLMVLMLNVIFYFIVNSLIESVRANERIRILQMQEKQYNAQQKYLETTARARHDFRHILRTLSELAEKGDNKTALDLLNQYIKNYPEKDTADYCGNNAVNALLNHYFQIAKDSHIRIEQHISLPDRLYIDIIDLCSVLGNVLENAITACQDVPEDERFVTITVSREQGTELYIAVSNSFSGKVNRKGKRYLSTKQGGNGIGLISITATAERYDGSADFYHEEKIFYSNIMMENRE